jgi:hypothetical protein
LQLQSLLKEGGGPGTLIDFLSQLTPEEVLGLQGKYPIHHLVTFISSNLAPATQGA